MLRTGAGRGERRGEHGSTTQQIELMPGFFHLAHRLFDLAGTRGKTLAGVLLLNAAFVNMKLRGCVCVCVRSVSI